MVFFSYLRAQIAICEVKMIVFNTTYTMPEADARDFVIWIHESIIPSLERDGRMKNARLLRILSHHDQETECMGLQMETDSTATLHKWYTEMGHSMNEELLRMFDERIVGFSTIMENLTPALSKGEGAEGTEN